MITHADDEQFFHIVQAMADLDFNDSLDPSRLTRLTKIPRNDPWFTGPYAPSIPDENLWNN